MATLENNGGNISVMNIKEVYTNVLLISIANNRNFGRLVKEAEKETKGYLAEMNGRPSVLPGGLPEGFSGIFFIESLARKTGSSLGEAYLLTPERKEDIILHLLQSIEPIEETYSDYYDDSVKDQIEFAGKVKALDFSDESKVQRYYQSKGTEEEKGDNSIVITYPITFQKSWNSADIKAPCCYAVHLSVDESFSSEFVFSDYIVWTGSNGPIADFIDRAINANETACRGHYEEKPVAEQPKAKNSLSNSNEVPFSEDKIKKDSDYARKRATVTCESDVSQKDILTANELIECIYEDTRTVELLDKFEGYGQIKPKRYQRIVIKNCKYRGLVHHKSTPGFNLVIERGHRPDHVGDITLTEFKQGNDGELSKYITSEITEGIVEEFLDADRFYRFSKPFLLRAQNSTNKSGYGWTWDWSNGYGDYTEGTHYGETTDYYFVGAYISSGFFYDTKKRKPFSPEEKSTACNEDAKFVSSVMDSPAKGEVLYTIKPYIGTVKSMTDNKTVTEYALVNIDESSKRFIPVAIDGLDNTIYVYKPHYEEHRTSLILSILQLYDKKGIKTRKLNVVPIVSKEGPTDIDNAGKTADGDTLSGIPANYDIKDDRRNKSKKEDVSIAKKEATVIKVLKSGDSCPACGRSNTKTEMIEVIDTNGNARTIIGLKCSCGTVYLTKKQFKKISNKTFLRIYEVNAPKTITPTKKRVDINPYPLTYSGKKTIMTRSGCKKCGKTPIAAGALSKGLRLCWECYKEEMSSTYDY